jgi:hypothetical protein
MKLDIIMSSELVRIGMMAVMVYSSRCLENGKNHNKECQKNQKPRCD